MLIKLKTIRLAYKHEIFNYMVTLVLGSEIEEFVRSNTATVGSYNDGLAGSHQCNESFIMKSST